MPRLSCKRQFEETGRSAIVGLGNLLRGDEGLGVHAVARISETMGDNIHLDVIDGGTLGLSLIEPIASCSSLILIDAVNLDEAPGTTRVFVGRGMDSFLVNLKTRTAHDVNLVDLIHALRLIEGLPQARALIAIQPGDLNWSTEVTSPVDAALMKLPDLCEELLNFMRHTHLPPSPDWKLG